MRYAMPSGCFEIDSLPSQVQVAVCHGFYVYEGLRGHGLAKTLHKQQISKLCELGYDYAMCTVTGDNPAQSKAIADAGWELMSEFKNTRKGDKTQVWHFDVQQYINSLDASGIHDYFRQSVAPPTSKIRSMDELRQAADRVTEVMA